MGILRRLALIGPRQVGKTTLALKIAKTRKALYLDLESREDRAKLVNPALPDTWVGINLKLLSGYG